MNQNDEKVERGHLCSASLLLFSALLQNLNSTELNRSWLDQTKLDWKAKKMSRNKIGFEEAEANLHPGNVEHPDQPWLQLVHPPALLGEPEHLGQI